MKALIVSSEAIPYCKTGGLADVAGALLKELRGLGLDAKLMIPHYSKCIKGFSVLNTGLSLSVDMRNKKYRGRLLKHHDTYFIDCEELFGREGLYGDKNGDFPDNDLRFSYLCRAVLQACKAIDFRPDVIHLNDWQTSLIPIYLKNDSLWNDFFRHAATVLTIHNLGYQGIFPPESLQTIGVSRDLFHPDGIEFYRKVNFLKAGILYADIINTVSRRYAEEMTTPEYGFGLDGVLKKRERGIYGILNGIDNTVWSPEKDDFLYKNYSKDDLRGKAFCKKNIKERCGIGIEKIFPIISYIGRLTEQKGIDLIVKILDRLIGYGCGLIILGKGDRIIKRALLNKASKYGGSIYLKTDFDEEFARTIYAGADIVIMPSRYEPCGLVQMIALKYGTVPVARNTGGLSDTIDDYNGLTDSGTGFLFDEYNPSAFLESIKRAFTVFTVKRRWHSLMRRGMEKDFSWKQSASKYLELYKKAIEGKKKNI